MNPIYKFELKVGNAAAARCYPNHSADLAITYTKEQGEQFYRKGFSGALIFQQDDFDVINNASFATKFGIVVYISYNAGSSWTQYLSGHFYKTDCQINLDDKTVTVTPTITDQYTEVLAGIDKEFDLIQLQPAMTPVKIDKRPLLQTYVAGDRAVGCILGGMWWEQECEPEMSDSVLVNTYHFYRVKSYIQATFSGEGELPPNMRTLNIYDPTTPGLESQNFYAEDDAGNKWNMYYNTGEYEGQKYGGFVVRKRDALGVWRAMFFAQVDVTSYSQLAFPQDVTLRSYDTPVRTISLHVDISGIYARYLHDVKSEGWEIPVNDIVPNNRNYTRVLQYLQTTAFFIVDIAERYSETPTKWGLYDADTYYLPPGDSVEYLPIARATWTDWSFWYTYTSEAWILENLLRKEFELKTSYALADVLKVLLQQIAPNILWDATEAYSYFLFAESNPIRVANQELLIAPKSNLIAAGYDQPAQKAPITLRMVLDMLRDCFRCYCYIDGDNRFRIEHIDYFRRGGSYAGAAGIAIDLTQIEVTRNGKKWDFAQNQIRFEKPEMAARYQFAWMDEVTQLFEGDPIDIISPYIMPGNIEQIQVAHFTSDVDYIILNPGGVSKDGFALLAPVKPKNMFNSQVALESLSTRFECQIVGPFTAGEALDIRISDVSTLFTNNTATVRDDTDAQIGTARGNETVRIVLPRETQWILITKEPENVIGNGTVNVWVEVPRKLPYIDYIFNNAHHYLQNGWVSFRYMRRYYRYDMPARNYEIAGTAFVAYGVKKLRLQNVTFPVWSDPNPIQLIKTSVGNGAIEKISINLSSRQAKAELRYDTE